MEIHYEIIKILYYMYMRSVKTYYLNTETDLQDY